MNRMIRTGLLGILLIVALLFVYAGATHRWFGHGGGKTAASGRTNSEPKIHYWYDEMNPQHHYNAPGKAPDGMDLLPKSANPPLLTAGDPSKSAASDMSSMPMGTVSISGDKQSLAGIRTAIIERKPLIRDIHTTAQIVADETRIAHIYVKVAGYVDRVYVDFVGRLVKKGQPLFTLYSPDLVSTQEEYLIAKRGTAPFVEVTDGAKSLLRSTRERLKLWDMSDNQIKQLDETGKVEKDLTFCAPLTGFVTDGKVFPRSQVADDWRCPGNYGAHGASLFQARIRIHAAA